VYHDLPVLKKPVWTWEVPLYFFVGGAAGAAAVIAAVWTMSGRRRVVARDARRIAAGGAVLSAALLTADLGRPERFIYMLRVFKPQSAMSVGSWTLAAFSATTGTVAMIDVLAARIPKSHALRLVQVGLGTLAAGLGAVMATYTGVLIGATAVPVWHDNIRLLPAHFGASGVASAVAVLDLAGHDDAALNELGLAAAAVETLLGAAIESRPSAASGPLKEGRSGTIVRIGGVLSGPAPLVCRALGRARPRWRRIASLTALAGSLLTRWGWIAAGRDSARDPVLPMLPADDSRTLTP
jgi:hypothetical protein